MAGAFEIARRWAAATAAIGLTMCIATTAAAQDAAGEVATARTHAGLAASAGNLDGVKTHLHHVVNCLSGPGGEGFDAAEANPCGGLGNGAIPDAGDGLAREELEEALEHAMAGLSASDHAAAQRAATKTMEALKAAAASLEGAQ